MAFASCLVGSFCPLPVYYWELPLFLIYMFFVDQKKKKTTEGIMNYIHIDVCGPTKTVYLGGKHYFLTFVDDFSKRVWVYTMRTKDEVVGKFLVRKKMMENQTGRKIKVLRLDNGTKYKSDPIFYVCKEDDIS